MTAVGRGGEDERRAQIEAAIEIAAVRGFADTTVEMISERAALDREAFDRSFAGLTDCFLAAWDALRGRYLERVEAAMDGSQDWPGRVRALARETTACAAAEPERARLLAGEILELGQAGRARLDALLHRLAELVDRGRSLAPDGARIPPSTAEGVIGGAHYRLLRELRSGEPTPPERLAAELTSFALAPYLGPDAAARELDCSN